MSGLKANGTHARKAKKCPLTFAMRASIVNRLGTKFASCDVPLQIRQAAHALP